MSFLPDGYKPATSGGKYAKLKPGANRFRILAPPIIGLEGWKQIGDKRTPVRKPLNDAFAPGEVDTGKDKQGRQNRVKEFWAMPAWNYSEGRIQVLHLTQSTIMDSLFALSGDPEWGTPTGYDVTIRRTGDGLETEYGVFPMPPKPLEKPIAEAWNELRPRFNMAAYWNNGDPFGDDAQEHDELNPPPHEEKLNPPPHDESEIPF